jgi:hypothetical protein
VFLGAVRFPSGCPKAGLVIYDSDGRGRNRYGRGTPWTDEPCDVGAPVRVVEELTALGSLERRRFGTSFAHNTENATEVSP